MKKTPKKYFFNISFFFVLIALIAYQGIGRAEGDFVDFSQERFSDEEIQSWVLRTLGIAYSFDDTNYQEHFEFLNCFFSQSAYENFYRHLKDDGYINAIVQKEQNLSVIAAAGPEITRRGIIRGNYSWQILIPLDITLEENKKKKRRFSKAESKKKEEVAIIRTDSIKLKLILSQILPLTACEESINIIRFEIVKTEQMDENG